MVMINTALPPLALVRPACLRPGQMVEADEGSNKFAVSHQNQR